MPGNSPNRWGLKQAPADPLHVVRQIVPAIYVIGLVVAVALFSRRLSGALTNAVSWKTWLFLGIVVVGYSLIARSLLSSCRASAWITPLVRFGPLVLGTCVFATFVRSDASAPGLLIFAALWLADAGSTWRTSAPGPSPLSPFAAPQQDREHMYIYGSPLERGAAWPGTLDQFCRRSNLQRADDQVEGIVRCHFLAGQRQAHAYLAFCPPFVAMPDVIASLIPPATGQVQIGQILTTGVRVDLRLDRPAPAESSALVQIKAAVVTS